MRQKDYSYCAFRNPNRLSCCEKSMPNESLIAPESGINACPLAYMGSAPPNDLWEVISMLFRPDQPDMAGRDRRLQEGSKGVGLEVTRLPGRFGSKEG